MKKPILLLLLSIVVVSCKKEAILSDHSFSPDASSSQNNPNHPGGGFLYTMSNDAGSNSILIFKQNSNGLLTYRSSIPSGGAGNGASLGSQGSLVIDAAHQWLYAVNPGNNTVSSFSINDGNLTLVQTVSSNGILPVSVTVHDNLLYVVNSTTSTICGYSRDAEGVLTMIPGSNQLLSTVNAGPAQISFSPDGQRLVVTEKTTHKISVYTLNTSGLPGKGTSMSSSGQTPFGFKFYGNNYIVVAEACGGTANASTVSSFNMMGNMSAASGPVANGQTAAGCMDITSDGKYVYVTNTQSNNISSYTMSNFGTVHLINAAEAVTGARPTDVVLSGNGNFLYNLNAASHSISQYRKGNRESLKSIGEITGLPMHATGLVAY